MPGKSAMMDSVASDRHPPGRCGALGLVSLMVENIFISRPAKLTATLAIVRFRRHQIDLRGSIPRRLDRQFAGFASTDQRIVRSQSA
jgi:hypothetical protein